MKIESLIRLGKHPNMIHDGNGRDDSFFYMVFKDSVYEYDPFWLEWDQVFIKKVHNFRSIYQRRIT